jgi:hypothetical protein
MAKAENTAGFENVTATKPEIDTEAATISIAKPGAFDLNKFKSKRAAAMANVETLLTALPHHASRKPKISSGCTPTRPPIGRLSCASLMCRSRVRSATRCT